MKRQPRERARLWLLEGALLLGLAWLLGIDRTDWIIRFGIVQADRLILLSWIGWGVLAVAGNIAYFTAVAKRARRDAAMPLKISFAPDQALTPSQIRAELIRYRGERPLLSELLDQGLSQLDNIARKKEKMAEILERNDVSLLSQASDALASAEQTLCRKLVLVLNRALLCDPEEKNVRRKEAVFQEHARTMQVFLMENEEVLNRCETLLTETVRYVEEKKAGRETMDLQIMTDVIRSLAGDGIRMDMGKGGATR